MLCKPGAVITYRNTTMMPCNLAQQEKNLKTTRVTRHMTIPGKTDTKAVSGEL